MANDLGQRLIWMGFKPKTDFILLDNSDGQGPRISEWLSSQPQPTDSEIAAAVEPPAPLPDLLPYQFRAMLKISGNETALTNYINNLSNPAKIIAQAKLEYSLIFERHNDLVLAAQAALGLTDTELDNLWKQAAAL